MFPDEIHEVGGFMRTFYQLSAFSYEHAAAQRDQ